MSINPRTIGFARLLRQADLGYPGHVVYFHSTNLNLRATIAIPMLANRMTFSVAIVLYFLAIPRGFAQGVPAKLMKSNQPSKRNVGSAAVMSGRIHVYHIFASDLNSTWDTVERDAVLTRMQEAYVFIQRQSRRHHIELSFSDEIARPVSYQGVLPTGTFANPKWTQQIIKETCNEEDSLSLTEKLKRQTNADNVVICVHVDKPALSYNLAYYANVAAEFAAERMVCFSQYPDTRPTAAATYAHEILHLFGAGDLYFPYDQDEDRKQIAKRLFPNDVMFRVDYNLSRLNVGPFTAYRIGWRQSLDPEHRQFED